MSVKWNNRETWNIGKAVSIFWATQGAQMQLAYVWSQETEAEEEALRNLDFFSCPAQKVLELFSTDVTFPSCKSVSGSKLIRTNCSLHSQGHSILNNFRNYLPPRNDSRYLSNAYQLLF